MTRFATPRKLKRKRAFVEERQEEMAKQVMNDWYVEAARCRMAEIPEPELPIERLNEIAAGVPR